MARAVTENDLMQPEPLRHPGGYPNLSGNPMNAARCGAHSRRTGDPCRAPAVRGSKRCRMHGGAAGSGGQPGNQNALKNGEYSAQRRGFEFIFTCLLFMIDGDRRRCRRVLRSERERRQAVVYCAKLMPEIAPWLASELNVDISPFERS